MTKQAQGAKTHLLLAYEANYGQTPASPIAYKLPFNKNTLTGKQELIQSNTITGRRDAQAPARGAIDATGNIEFPLDSRAIGYWLTLMFGQPSTTSAGGVYTHIFKITDTMPSATIEKGYNDITSFAQYPGCKISKFSLSTSIGKNELVANVDLVGANEIISQVGLSASPAVMQLERFNSFQATVMEADVVLGNCRKFDLAIDFGLDTDTYCLNGSATRTDISEGIVQVTGTIETLFKDLDLLNKAVNGTESKLKIKFANSPHSLEFLVPELVFERSTPPVDGPKGILLTSAYRGYFSDGSENSAIQVTLVNDIASYAM